MEPGKLGNSQLESPDPAAATGRHQIWKRSDGNGEGTQVWWLWGRKLRFGGFGGKGVEGQKCVEG